MMQLLKLVEIVGEAANRGDAADTAIPWPQIIGRATGARYEADILWKIIHLPAHRTTKSHRRRRTF